MPTEKVINGVSIKKWKKAFAEATRTAIDKDYFSDILFYDLYPDAPQETEEDYDALWNSVKEAFKEIFNETL